MFDYWLFHILNALELLTGKPTYLKGAASLVSIHHVTVRATRDIDMMLWDTPGVVDWQPSAMTPQMFDTNTRKTYYEHLKCMMNELPGMLCVVTLIQRCGLERVHSSG